MIQFIEFKGVKHPFIIAFSTLIEFEKQTGKSFISILSNSGDTVDLAKNLVIILKLGVASGYEQEGIPLLKRIWNILRSGSKFGISKKQWVLMVDNNWQFILRIIPDFFYDMQDVALDAAEDIATGDTVKKK